MNSQTLGSLVRDVDFPELLVSEPLATAFFPDHPIRIVFDGVENDRNPEEFETAARNFFGLTLADKRAAERFVDLDYQAALADPPIAFNNEPLVIRESIWERVSPVRAEVSRRAYGDMAVYVRLCLYCDWNIEGGLQIVFRNGNVLCKVSDQDGHLTTADAFDLPEEEDEIY